MRKIYVFIGAVIFSAAVLWAQTGLKSVDIGDAGVPAAKKTVSQPHYNFTPDNSRYEKLKPARMVRLLFTFDDGPSVEKYGSSRTPTEIVLDTLAAEKIKAVFFVLTDADTYRPFYNLFHRYQVDKANSPQGFNLLRREVREGHLLAVHWGGKYHAQTELQPTHLTRPAYDYDGDGNVDKVTEKGSALETELLECMNVIKQAYAAEGRDYAPEFMRPPVYKYLAGKLDARPTYKALGLKMILSDSTLGDGGYPGAGLPRNSMLRASAYNTVKNGETDVVITLHDSNIATARKLPGLITLLRNLFKAHGLVEGETFKFVDSADEAVEIMRNKKTFHTFPGVVVDN